MAGLAAGTGLLACGLHEIPALGSARGLAAFVEESASRAFRKGSRVVSGFHENTSWISVCFSSRIEPEGFGFGIKDDAIHIAGMGFNLRPDRIADGIEPDLLIDGCVEGEGGSVALDAGEGAKHVAGPGIHKHGLLAGQLRPCIAVGDGDQVDVASELPVGGGAGRDIASELIHVKRVTMGVRIVKWSHID